MSPTPCSRAATRAPETPRTVLDPPHVHLEEVDDRAPGRQQHLAHLVGGGGREGERRDRAVDRRVQHLDDPARLLGGGDERDQPALEVQVRELDEQRVAHRLRADPRAVGEEEDGRHVRGHGHPLAASTPVARSPRCRGRLASATAYADVDGPGERSSTRPTEPVLPSPRTSGPPARISCSLIVDLPARARSCGGPARHVPSTVPLAHGLNQQVCRSWRDPPGTTKPLTRVVAGQGLVRLG